MSKLLMKFSHTEELKQIDKEKPVDVDVEEDVVSISSTQVCM